MQIKILKQPGYEKVAAAEDGPSGLRAIIAVHNTKLGPGLGGIRMHPYPDEMHALNDVLRLARGMSYKSASVDLSLGGAKAVIIGNPVRDKSPALFQRMGEFIETFKGTYYAAKDAGMTTDDLVQISKSTSYVTGLPWGSGDPSHLTANGILAGMRLAAHFKLGRENLEDVHVAIQGLGHVGYDVAKLLHFEGAKLTVADLDRTLAHRVRDELGAEVTAPDDIYDIDADIFSPCAMGGILNSNTIPRLRAAIVAGSANNQLLQEKEDGLALFERKILYAPDYMINAGGVINIYVRDILKQERPEGWLVKIEDNLRRVFELSESEGVPTSEAADRLTEAKLR